MFCNQIITNIKNFIHLTEFLIKQTMLFLNWTLFLSFLKLLTIHGVSRSRTLIIRIREQFLSKQHVSRWIDQGVGRRQFVDYRPTIGRLSISITEGLLEQRSFFFLCFVRKLTYHKCSFSFPLLLIQIRAEKPAFFPLSCHKPHSFRAFYKVRRYWQVFTRCNCYSKLNFNWSWLKGCS